MFIQLVYPQKSNAPKRQDKTLKTDLVSETYTVNVSGVLGSQANNPAVAVEYFLDGRLIYSNTEGGPMFFKLNTLDYGDGEHVLTANLWDKNGPSAIGMKKIIVRNQRQNEQ